jgi:hypothetical protein
MPGLVRNKLLVNVFTLPNMLCKNSTTFSRHGPRIQTDQGYKPASSRTPIYPPGPYKYWQFHFDENAIRRLRGSRGRTWVEVLLRFLYNRDNAAIST